jgi:hypothetical protein
MVTATGMDEDSTGNGIVEMMWCVSMVQKSTRVGNIYESTFGPQVFTDVQQNGELVFTMSEECEGPRTREQQAVWELSVARQAERRCEEERWEVEWNLVGEDVQAAYHLIEECIEEAVFDPNGTNRWVVLKYAKRMLEV